MSVCTCANVCFCLRNFLSQLQALLAFSEASITKITCSVVQPVDLRYMAKCCQNLTHFGAEAVAVKSYIAMMPLFSRTESLHTPLPWTAAAAQLEARTYSLQQVRAHVNRCKECAHLGLKVQRGRERIHSSSQLTYCIRLVHQLFMQGLLHTFADSATAKRQYVRIATAWQSTLLTLQSHSCVRAVAHAFGCRCCKSCWMSSFMRRLSSHECSRSGRCATLPRISRDGNCKSGTFAVASARHTCIEWGYGCLSTCTVSALECSGLQHKASRKRAQRAASAQFCCHPFTWHGQLRSCSVGRLLTQRCRSVYAGRARDDGGAGD